MATTRRNAMLIDEAREKIRTTQLINRLQDHALGKIEMSPTQIKATEILLRKRIPDLQSISGDLTVKRDLKDMSTDELLSALGDYGVARAERSGSEPGKIH